MCGLHGEISFGTKSPDLSRHQRINEKLHPRGPDGGGIFQHNHVLLGHRRLKIIDLSEHSAQPLHDPELGLSIVFNGAIYNYAELRDELIKLGYRFFSRGDTEVILKAYHAWGDSFVERLNGMFAFALFERESGHVLLGRDRLGIKPLYLARNKDGLRFASSLPALLAGGDIETDIDQTALHHYLSWHAVVPAPRTLFNGVRKLPPAHLMRITPEGVETYRQYWSLSYANGGEKLSAEEYKWQLKEQLRQAVKRRLVADVPVGLLLSGGLDSSLLVALIRELDSSTQLKTFSIGFDDVGEGKGNEFAYSDWVAEHYATEHQKIHISQAEVLEHLDDTIGAMSEPMVSHDVIGFYLLSREVSKQVKVVQSGQGADEVFAGYHWYPPLQGHSDPAACYQAHFFDHSHDELGQLLQADYLDDNDPSRRFVEGHFRQPGVSDPVDHALRLDTQVMLVDDPVKRVDNMSMAWGLEARVPFIDHKLVELAAQIPAEHKLKHGGKGILKDVAADYFPQDFIHRPKGYFPVPALTYLRGNLLTRIKDALSSQRAQTRDMIRPEALQPMFDAPDEHISKLGGSKLWQLGLLELWLQQVQAA